MKGSRLLPALLAVAILGSALAAGALWSRALLDREIHALAPQMFADKHRGAVIQRAGFRQPDLLPLYGSSDLNVADPLHASALFREYPSGFTVFPVGNLGSASLTWLQAIAAVGPEMRGRKVAVSVAARLFLADMLDAPSYAANFSALHAYALAFGELSLDVKRGAARRMLRYPATLGDHPLLRFALERLAGGSPLDRLGYYASVPLGRLRVASLVLQDHWRSFSFLRAQLGLGSVRRESRALDWADLLRRAEEDSRRRAEANPFGFDQAFWANHAAEISMQKGLWAATAESVIGNSAEWTDFELLLRAIRELGGEPLILAVPIHDPYFDHLGVPPAARALYAERVRALAAAHGATLVDFDGRTARDFTVDPAPHLSGEGWVRFGRVLEQFFHGRAGEAL